jgi:hypothetical protein
MAQWMGQYTGNTHGFLVAEREEQLRHAIGVYRQKDTISERKKQSKTVLRMADRLVSARIKVRKANRPAETDGPPDEKLQRIVEDGNPAILREFDIAEIL